jgi:hypothetical protein
MDSLTYRSSVQAHPRFGNKIPEYKKVEGFYTPEQLNKHFKKAPKPATDGMNQVTSSNKDHKPSERGSLSSRTGSSNSKKNSSSSSLLSRPMNLFRRLSSSASKE